MYLSMGVCSGYILIWLKKVEKRVILTYIESPWRQPRFKPLSGSYQLLTLHWSDIICALLGLRVNKSNPFFIFHVDYVSDWFQMVRALLCIAYIVYLAACTLTLYANCCIKYDPLAYNPTRVPAFLTGISGKR